MLFTFPSRYSFAIGHHRVFSLGGWAPRIRAGFHVSRPTWDPARPPLDFGYGALTPCGRPFQTVPLSSKRATPRSRNPRRQAAWFGLLRFRSPLLAQSRLMSLPAGTEMFHFPASRPRGLCVQPRVMGDKPHRIAPFGNPRIKVCLPLPGAYRSLPRPSSPDGAKASVVRPYTLSRSASGTTRKPPPLGLRCILPRNVQLPKIENPLKDTSSGGRAWNRTRDLVLIRDAL